MAKTKQAISHAVTSFALLIALLIILVLMAMQAQNQQTTSSQASEMMGTGTCRPYFLYATYKSFKGKCGIGGTQYVDFTCNNDKNHIPATRGSDKDCKTQSEWRAIAEEYCKNKYGVIEKYCGATPKLQPTHGIQPQY